MENTQDSALPASLPAWCAELQASLARMADTLRRELHPWQVSERVFCPEDFGSTPGEKATQAIQRAIDQASNGGGIVRLRHGDYVSGALVMRSRVCLEICAGARLLGSTNLADYPEHHARRLTVQDTSMGMHQSLIFAEGCEDIALRGPGEINGRGTPDHFPGNETAQGTPGRPFVLRAIDCRRITVQDLTLRDSPCWMQNYLNCEDLLIERVTVRNHANYNNDGMDIDGCRRVLIRNCDVRSGDDALCFKGAGQRELSDVLVENCSFLSACNAVKVGTDTQGDFRRVWVRSCRIGGLLEDPSGLKHPWCDSAVSLEMVDGGCLENILLTDLTIERAWSPFFMRLEDRGRVKPGDPKPAAGTLRNAAILRVTGTDCGPRGSYFVGIPEKAIESICLHDIHIRQKASSRPALREQDIGELRGVYPDAHMIDALGDAPAYALWARHVHGLTLDAYEVTPEGDEARPALVAESDVQDLHINM